MAEPSATRRLQFNLRSLLLLITCCAVSLALIALCLERETRVLGADDSIQLRLFLVMPILHPVIGLGVGALLGEKWGGAVSGLVVAVLADAALLPRIFP